MLLEGAVGSEANVEPLEEVTLFTLGEHGEFESVSELWVRGLMPTSLRSE